MLKKIQKAKDYISKKYSQQIDVAIVLGSGLGDFAQQLENSVTIAYEDIPHFVTTSVEGHQGQLIIGKLENKTVLCMQGRVHLYEGHPIEDVVFAVRVFSQMGIPTVILTNASGGINKNYKPGDLVCIKDHINLTGRNPLIGKNIPELGPRFPDMSDTYNKEIRQIIEQSCQKIGVEYKEGIYCSVLGPSYETPAEIMMLKAIGGDLVGMSTVPESIAAHHAGLKVAGISCVTNLAAGISLDHLSHDDVKSVAMKAKEKFSHLLRETVRNL